MVLNDTIEFQSASFLVTLTVIGNMLFQTFGCNTQNFFSQNLIAKQAIIIFLFYFALGHTNSENNHPRDTLIAAIAMWVFFILLTSNNIYFVCAAILIYALTYFLKDLANYYHKKDSKTHAHFVNKLRWFIQSGNYIAVGIIVIGFLWQLLHQFKYNGTKWSIPVFLFGAPKCA